MAGKSKNKLALILLIVSALILSLPSQQFAQNISTGDASAQSSVRNEVNGGDVYTKIEVEANGEKKVLETNEPGEHVLSVSSDKNENLSPKPDLNSEENKAATLPSIQKIFDFISDLFDRIVSIFGR